MSEMTLRTVRDVIQALGGDKQLGQMLNVGQSAVGNWKLRNKFPPSRHISVVILLLKKGCNFSPDIFGLSQDDAVYLLGCHHSRRRPTERTTQPSSQLSPAEEGKGKPQRGMLVATGQDRVACQRPKAAALCADQPARAQK